MRGFACTNTWLFEQDCHGVCGQHPAGDGQQGGGERDTTLLQGHEGQMDRHDGQAERFPVENGR
jgi:hypothetical protein